MSKQPESNTHTEANEPFPSQLREAIYSGKELLEGGRYSPEEARETVDGLVRDLAAAGLPVKTGTAWGWPWGLIIELRGDASSYAQLMLAVPVYRHAMNRDDFECVRTKLRHLRKQLKITVGRFCAEPSCYAEFSKTNDGAYFSIDISDVAQDPRFRRLLVDELLPTIESEVVVPFLRTVTTVVKQRLSRTGAWRPNR